MSASWEMALAEIESLAQQIEHNKVLHPVASGLPPANLALAFGHLLAGGDIRRKSWIPQQYVTTVSSPGGAGGEPMLALVRANNDHLPGWVFSQQDIFALDWELLPQKTRKGT